MTMRIVNSSDGHTHRTLSELLESKNWFKSDIFCHIAAESLTKHIKFTDLCTREYLLQKYEFATEFFALWNQIPYVRDQDQNYGFSLWAWRYTNVIPYGIDNEDGWAFLVDENTLTDILLGRA